MRQPPPDPVDINAGAILRATRLHRGLSQTELGHAADVSFQQIQKYERGTNRMSLSTLYKLARALDIPVAGFFAGLDGALPPGAEPGAEEIKLLRFYRAIRPPAARAHVVNLAAALAGLNES